MIRTRTNLPVTALLALFLTAFYGHYQFVAYSGVLTVPEYTLPGSAVPARTLLLTFGWIVVGSASMALLQYLAGRHNWRERTPLLIVVGIAVLIALQLALALFVQTGSLVPVLVWLLPAICYWMAAFCTWPLSHFIA